MNPIGQTLDVDSHEMAPTHMWGEVFGEAAGRIAMYVDHMYKDREHSGANNLYSPSVLGDLLDINDDTVWQQRGVAAPGAFDFSRRLAVLDQMGITKQMIFPSFALAALTLMSPRSRFRGGLDALDLNLDDTECAALGRAGLDEYNAWAARVTALDPDRLRPVAYVPPCSNAAELYDETMQLVDTGVRVVHIPHGTPPGGRTPSHPDLDPFWAALSESKIVVTTHVGAESGFLESREWNNAPAFALGKVRSHELGLEPYSLATLHLPVANFLTSMVLGGVFERHPGLRFGVIELGCSWFGPLAENLDMWYSEMYSERLAPFISKVPSAYFNSNIRVTPFNEVDSIDECFRRYPWLSDTYCYSSDYPHVEGGKDSARLLLERLEPLGEDVLDRFFKRNALLLFPE